MMYKVFISYKTGIPNDQEAELLFNALARQGFDVFLDKREFHAGIIWDQSIYQNISESDVLIVLITPDAASPWVQREVDYALGCRVEILPVILSDADEKQAENVLKKLAIEKLQYARAYGSHKPDLRYGEVFQSVPILAVRTRANQNEWVRQLQAKWKRQNEANPLLQPFKPTTRSYARYAFFTDPRHAHPCTIHLAAGSITEISGVDVLVNSENVYMQMQRVFARGVSKNIRVDGARTRGRHYIEEDTIQHELNSQLFSNGGLGVPVSQGTVLITTAGDANSKLRKRGIRFVLHVAVVDANTDTEFPVQHTDVVQECVVNCLEKISDLSQSGEVVESVILPVLASGNAGMELSKSAAAILNAFKHFLLQNPQTTLKDIYLTGYTKGDVQTLTELFDADPQLRRL